MLSKHFLILKTSGIDIKYSDFFREMPNMDSWYERLLNGENVDGFISWQALCEAMAILDILEAGSH
jgi:hypothetical protein